MIYKFHKYIINTVRKNDILAEKVMNRFHFDSDIKNKTFIGGFITITVYTYILYITFCKGIDVY